MKIRRKDIEFPSLKSFVVEKKTEPNGFRTDIKYLDYVKNKKEND